MKILITGSPGTGKTTVARLLAKQLNYQVLNEKDFAAKNNIGFVNREKELEIPIKKFQAKLNNYLKKQDNVILEGHVLCEAKLPADFVFVLTTDPVLLEKRLSKRKYKYLKILDDVFCEETKYCLKKILEKYPKNKVFEVKNEKSLNLVIKRILNKLSNLKYVKKNKRGKNE